MREYCSSLVMSLLSTLGSQYLSSVLPSLIECITPLVLWLHVCQYTWCTCECTHSVVTFVEVYMVYM